ncbi:hypothetical protein RCO48_28680 [Peribacillus frigoritolerans]|nr:hypothetical protein [Peribacillus frigoritolerans]
MLLNKHSLFPIPNYGSAMSPFFTALSLWVGGTILISMLSVGVSQKVYSPYQIYIGRYLIFFIIGVMQALSVSIGNIVLIGIYVADKFEYILFFRSDKYGIYTHCLHLRFRSWKCWKRDKRRLDGPSNI